MNPLFELHDIHVSYGTTEIVHGVSLALEQGELCALLGLNGSGKTTLLRAVCGLIPAQGSCSVCGRPLAGMRERERAKLLSFIPQVSSPIHGKTVMEVLLMGCNPHLRLLESPSAAHRQQAMDALAKLNMEPFAQRPFSKLSQGQKQLIILARTLVQNTPVMLMDEPDSALDFLNRHMVLSQIRNLIRAENRAGLITLHDPNFAMAYCDRLLLLQQGRVAAELNMHTADLQEVRQKLSLIYGKIELLSNGNGYLMGKAQ